MLTKFLYFNDEIRRKKVISAVIENEAVPTNVLDTRFPMFDARDYQKKDTDIIQNNYGDFYYCEFDDNGVKKYLDIDTYNDQVKINITTNINHAAALSKDVLGIILDNVDYFGLDDCVYIKSGYSLGRKGILNDEFKNFFRHLPDRSFCQIRKNGSVFYVGLNEDKKYILTNNFDKAIRVNKMDMRSLLTINNYIDSTLTKDDLSFSEYNTFLCENGFIIGGFTPLKVTFSDDTLEITADGVKIGVENKMVNSEEISNALHDLVYKMKNKDERGETILQYNEYYLIKEAEGKFKLTLDATLASKLTEYDMDIFISAMALFIPKKNIKRFSGSLNYIYNNDGLYTIGHDLKENAKLIHYQQFVDLEELIANIKDVRYDGFLLIDSDNKYVKLTLKNNGFKIEYLESGYSATLFKENEAHVLEKVLEKSFMKKDIHDLLKENDTTVYNISYGENDYVESYQEALNKIGLAKHKICSYESFFDIKLESEKGSLEYIREAYAKGVLDSYSMFKKALTKFDFISNVLIISSSVNLEVIGLDKISNELDRRINFSTVNLNKRGYYPKIKLNKKLKYAHAYRMNFNSLPSILLDQYDMIVFTKEFEDDVFPLMDQLIKSGRRIVIASLKYSTGGLKKDNFHEDMKKYVDLKRKFFNHEELEFEKFAKINEEFKKQMNMQCNCKKECGLPIIMSNKASYLSMALIDGKVIDLFK